MCDFGIPEPEETIKTEHGIYAKSAVDKLCDVPYCDTNEKPTIPFDNHNITCMSCGKFSCSKCCDQIWKGEWNNETFYKPKFIAPHLKHEVFMCPFCRATFDRMRIE